MDVVGYAEIKKDAKTGRSPIPIENFIGKPCRVMEFNKEGDVLLINSEATALATFDACDVYRKFECKVVGDILTPPEMNMVEQMIYVTKVQTRKGKFTDSLLFAMQNNPEYKSQD